MAEEMLYQEATKAIQKGDKKLARDLLTRLIKADPQNPDYWLLLSTVVDTIKERIYCLQEVMLRDPKNMTARQGLILMGAQVPSKESVENIPSPRRNWQALWLDRLAPSGTPLNRRIILPISGGILALILIAAGMAGMFNKKHEIILNPAPTLKATSTYTGLGTHSAISMKTEPSNTPLWLNMSATYTPTPLYVATPHPRTESYRTGVIAFENGDWEKAIEYFRQVISIEPDSADIYYLIGEIYRQEGKYTEALKEINQAIKINPNFAPAYLSRARINLAKNPKSNVQLDLIKATTLDSNFGEAYIELAANLVANDDAVAALDALNTAESGLPNSPLIPLFRSEAYLVMNQPELALQYAEKAFNLDIVNLRIYRAMGFALQEMGSTADAQSYLEIYTVYNPADAEAYTRLGLVYYQNKNFEGAVDIFSKALELNPTLIENYLDRGLAYLEQGDGLKALTDFFKYLEFKPNSFAGNLAVGRAYLVMDDKGEAYRQIENSKRFAKADEDFSQFYYYHATSLELLGYPEAALKDWKALAKLPQSAVPEDWWQIALQKSGVITPTATATKTPLTRSATP